MSGGEVVQMLPLDAPRAACTDRLDLVDEAMGRARGRNSLDKHRRAVRRLKRECCDHCPIREACHIEGLSQKPNVRGAWG